MNLMTACGSTFSVGSTWWDGGDTNSETPAHSTGLWRDPSEKPWDADGGTAVMVRDEDDDDDDLYFDDDDDDDDEYEDYDDPDFLDDEDDDVEDEPEEDDEL